MADGTTKPIAQVQVGDAVESLDWGTSQPCRGVVREVHQYRRAFQDRVYRVDGIPLTGPHRIAVGWDRWITAEALRTDARVFDGRRWRGVAGKVEEPWRRPVYNLEVPGPDNFFVTDGTQTLLVHNGGGKHGGGWIRPGPLPGPEEFQRLLEGEYVVNPRAAQQFGPLLEWMNRVAAPSVPGLSQPWPSLRPRVRGRG